MYKGLYKKGCAFPLFAFYILIKPDEKLHFLVGDNLKLWHYLKEFQHWTFANLYSPTFLILEFPLHLPKLSYRSILHILFRLKLFKVYLNCITKFFHYKKFSKESKETNFIRLLDWFLLHHMYFNALW